MPAFGLLGGEAVCYIFSRYSGSGNVQDESGNGNHGTIGSSCSISGSGVVLTQGYNQFISPQTKVLSGASQLTISMWVSDTSSGFISPRFAANSLGATEVYLTDASGILSCKIETSNGAVTAQGTIQQYPRSSAGLHHIAVTYDGTEIQLYVNGNTDGSAVSQTGSVTSSTRLETFGATNSSTIPWSPYPYSSIIGSIQDCRIWNDRALSAADIAFLATAPEVEVEVAVASGILTPWLESLVGSGNVTV